MIAQFEKDAVINKFMGIEEWAFRGRHLIERMDKEKIKTCVRRIRLLTEELEVMMGMED